MVYARYNGTVQDTNGRAVPNAFIEVRRSSADNSLVPLFIDPSGSTPLGNPFSASADGHFFFHTRGNFLRIRAYLGDSFNPTFEAVWDQVPVGSSQGFDVEDLGQALSAGIVPFATEAELLGYAPVSDTNVGALVLDDPDPTKNGYWTWDPTGEVWAFRRGLPDTFSSLVSVGGTPNAITANVAPGVDPATIQVFLLQPTAANTGATTLNIGQGVKPLVDVRGAALSAGLLASNRPVMFRLDGSNYRLISDPDADAAAQLATDKAAEALASAGAAAASASDAEDAADRAEAAASSVEFPVSYAPQTLSPEEQAQARQNIGVEDAGSIPFSLLSLALSESTSNYVFIVSVIADAFKSLGLVNVAGATGLDTSEAGFLKPTINYSADLTTVPFAISSGNASGDPAHAAGNAFDNSSSTSWLSNLTGAAVAGASWIGQDFGAGNAKTIRRVTIIQTYANGLVTNGWVEWSDNGSSWTTVGTIAAMAVNVLYTIDIAASGAHRYWRFRAANGPATGNSWWVNEVQMMELNGFSNLTVASEILPCADQPARIGVVARLIPTDAITLNTDLFMDVSRDGGTTWSQVVLDLVDNSAGVSIISSDALDVSGQPAGTSPRWRLRSANNKNFKVDGIALSLAA